MYIETSSPRRQGDKARLISPVYQPTTGRCMTFYYHMFGSSIGALNIYLRRNAALGGPVWFMAGNKGNVWNAGQVTLNSNVPFQVNKELSLACFGMTSVCITNSLIYLGLCTGLSADLQ